MSRGGRFVEVTARYRLNGDDGLECLRVHAPGYKRHALVSVLAPLGIVAIGVAYLLQPGSKTMPWVTVAIGAAILAFGVVQRIFLVRRLRQVWSQAQATELVVSDAGISATANGVCSEVAWSRFVRFAESKKHFLLYSSADLYNIVPKRGFASSEDTDAFRQLATRVLGKG